VVGDSLVHYVIEAKLPDNFLGRPHCLVERCCETAQPHLGMSCLHSIVVRVVDYHLFGWCRLLLLDVVGSDLDARKTDSAGDTLGCLFRIRVRLLCYHRQAGYS